MKSPNLQVTLDAELSACQNALLRKIRETLVSLESIWNDMGVHGEAKTARLGAVQTHVSRLLQEMVDEETSNKMAFVKRIEQHLQDLNELRKELSGEFLGISDEGLDSAPLYQVEKCLREKLDQLNKVKEERLEQLEILQKRHQDVRFRLGKTDPCPPTEGITEMDVEALKCRVESLEQERDRLQSTFEETQAAIKRIFDELEMKPAFPFEASVLASSADSFILSLDNMQSLKKLYQTMEQKLSDAKETATELRERLSNLWERLQISGDHREKFLHAHRGYSNPTINALKQELKKCEALKRANIENFVLQLREEIMSWWDRCHFSLSQRKEFSAFRYTEFNEDVLDLHELEVNKLRAFYESNRDIFQLAEERNELWQKMLELENRANDPNRLFNNRGGQLLKEERERNALCKALPKIEKDLREHLILYNQENKVPFTYDGEDLLELIEKQNEERQGMKELQKQQKKVTRNQLLEVESKLGTKATTPTSVKRGRLAPATPSLLPGGHQKSTISASRSAPPKTLTTTLKRKADNSPYLSVSKKSKGGKKSSEKRSTRSGNKSGPRFSTSKIRRYGKGGHKVAETSSSKTRRNIMSHLPIDSSIASGIGPYSEFQYQLEMMSAEKACRSSVVPKSYLRERNTPVSTPSSVSSTTKLTLTPGRIQTATHLTLTPSSATPFSITPMKPPRRNGVAATTTPSSQVRRTSTRLNLKSPSLKSPSVGNNTRLTTPRSRLPIVF